MVVKIYDKLNPHPSLKLPSGRPTDDPKDWLRLLFGEWSHYKAIPGLSNKDITANQTHPDILEPYNKILPLWYENKNQILSVSQSELPIIPLHEPLVLIGGPVSNDLARQWQGYIQSPSSGIYEYTKSKVRRRWRFEYNLGESKENGPARYLNGKLHRSWPQAIIDQEKNQIIRPRLSTPDRLISEDWMVFSFVPNVIDNRLNTAIIDTSDLHGQGNKAFSEILTNPKRIVELFEMLKKKNLRPNDYFQALYRIDVLHEKNTTVIKDFHLIDLSPANW